MGRVFAFGRDCERCLQEREMENALREAYDHIGLDNLRNCYAWPDANPGQRPAVRDA